MPRPPPRPLPQPLPKWQAVAPLTIRDVSLLDEHTYNMARDFQ